MYFIENNELNNTYRIKINRNDINKDMIIFLYSEYKKINSFKSIYLTYHILELDLIGYDNFIEKYFIICKNYKDLNNLKKLFDIYNE